MEKKFVLTEEESKRILSLHKKKIEENIGNRIPLNEDNRFYNKTLKMVRDCRTNFPKKFQKPTLDDPTITLIADAINNAISVSSGTDEAAILSNLSRLVTVSDFCRLHQIYFNRNQETLIDDLDWDVDNEADWQSYIWKPLSALKNSKISDGGGSTTTSKCPKIEKWFKDNGFVMITKQRYDQLANDNTRIRKYKYCPISKTNLYFAKVKGATQGGGGETGPITGGGGTVRYGFNYQDALNALKSKGCSVTGGGASDEENFADDWRSTENQKQTVNTTVSKENIQSWAS